NRPPAMGPIRIDVSDQPVARRRCRCYVSLTYLSGDMVVGIIEVPRVACRNPNVDRDRAGAGVGAVDGITQTAMRHCAYAGGIRVIGGVDRNQRRRSVVVLNCPAAFAVGESGIYG